MMMVPLALVLIGAVCALMAIQAHRLLTAALWLALASALVAILFYQLGAYELAVIELSVGSGLVTVLLFLAISTTGDQPLRLKSVVPRWLALLLTVLALALVASRTLPDSVAVIGAVSEDSFSAVLWNERLTDLLLQIALIIIGLIAVLGLLHSPEPPGKRAGATISEPTARLALLEEAL